MTRDLGRIPKMVLFGAAALIQAGSVAAMVIDRAGILRSGTDVMLHARPVDPRDFLRGDYVALAYNISNVGAGTLKNQSARRGATVYVKLFPDREGFYQSISAYSEPIAVTSPEVLIRGRVIGGDSCGRNDGTLCGGLQVHYNIERYFVPEGGGPNLESARNQGKLAVVVAVAPDGRAAIRRLLIDGMPVYEEPWF